MTLMKPWRKRATPPVSANGRWLDLSERIFDPSDARWLEEELAFPKLAKALMLERKRLAIRWLKALQASFDELVRTPEIVPGEAAEAASAGSWRMLWLTIRFKLLVSYALIVVKIVWPLPSIDSIHFVDSIFTRERAQFPACGLGA